jgi:hypothetical protein
MHSIITGRRASKHLVWLALAGAGLMAVSGCNKVPLLAPGLSTISLSTSSSIVQANGTAEIRATVLEGSGTPVQNGTTVTFTTNLGKVSPAETKTVNGVATVQFVANGQSGIAVIRANSGAAKSADSTATTTTAPSIQLTVGGAAASRIGLTANPSTVPFAGGTSTIVANVVDASGNPLGSVAVTFSTDAGSLSTAVATTDQSGNAQATLTTNKSATVTATAGGSTGTGATATTPATGTVKVNVNAPGTVTVTTSPAPPTAAIVGQPVSVSVTLTPSASGTAVQRVVLDFGDGVSSTLGGTSTSVPHTYTRTGNYVIRATAFDTFGDSATNTANLLVNSAPKPTATISGAGAAAGTATTFTLTAVASSGAQLEAVTLDFGDGSSQNFGGSAPGSVQHIYAVAGTYTATLSVSDSNSSASASTSIVIPAPATLTVTLTAVPPTGGTAGTPTTVLFTALVTGNSTPVVRYDWTFSSGTSGQPSSYSTTINQTTRAYTKGEAVSTATVAVTAGGQTGGASVLVTP